MHDALGLASIDYFPRFTHSNPWRQSFAKERFQTPAAPDSLQENRLENQWLSDLGLRHAGEISTSIQFVVLFSMRRFVKYWLPILIWMVYMFIGSTDLMSAAHTSRFLGPFLRWLIPDISEPTLLTVQVIVRKCAHLTEYAILASLFFRALRQGQQRLGRAAISSLVLVLICACLDEFHQSFVPSREASVFDVLIDVTGAILGIAIYRFLIRKFERRSKF